MPSVEKALLKAAALDELVSELQENLNNAEKNSIGIAAARDSTERLAARVHGYRQRIDRAFEDGTFIPESKDPVYAVFRDLVSIVQDSHRALTQAAGEQVPFASGLRKALSLAQARARAERAAAERAAEIEAEDKIEAEERVEIEYQPLVPEPQVVEPPITQVVDSPSPDVVTEAPPPEVFVPPPSPVVEAVPVVDPSLPRTQPPRRTRRGRATDT